VHLPLEAFLPDASRANFDHNWNDTSRVEAYSGGAGPYRSLDQAGNVLEWTADWYDAGYYAVSQASDPAGPSDGRLRVARGGSWTANERGVRSSHRFVHAPALPAFDIAFAVCRMPSRESYKMHLKPEMIGNLDVRGGFAATNIQISVFITLRLEVAKMGTMGMLLSLYRACVADC
jgi:hypothetical protein